MPANESTANFDEIELTVINELMEDIMIALMIVLSMEKTCSIDDDGH